MVDLLRWTTPPTRRSQIAALSPTLLKLPGRRVTNLDSEGPIPGAALKVSRAAPEPWPQQSCDCPQRGQTPSEGLRPARWQLGPRDATQSVVLASDNVGS